MAKSLGAEEPADPELLHRMQRGDESALEALYARYGGSVYTLALRLIACDDDSKAERAQENVLRLLTRERVDLLLGPYSSGLTMAVAPLAEAHGKILWNHGGASDAIWERGGRHVVSVPSPASDYPRTLP